jgi:Tol biopolymer transport system component
MEKMSMNTWKANWCVVVVVYLCCTSAGAAENNDKPGVMLQEAKHEELVNGNLEAAIGVYKRILEQHGGNSLMAAQTLVGMGQCYEKLGKSEAKAAYERVIRDFSEQSKAVAVAQKRLTALALAVNDSANVTVRLGAIEGSGAPAPNNQFLTLVDWSTGDLAIREHDSDQLRRLTNKGSWRESWANANSSVVSPDSKKVAYSWFPMFEKGHSDEACNELRIVGLDGSEPRVLCREPQVFIQTHQWSPDGKSILARFQDKRDRTNRIVLVSVDDGSVQVIKELGKLYPIKVSISSDSRYVVFDLRTKEGAANRDIYLLDTMTGEELKLVEHPKTDYGPVWTPDGKSVVFFSDRSGNVSLWRLDVVNGRPHEKPVLIRQDMNRMVPMGFTSDGSLYCHFNTGQSDVYIATVDPESGKAVLPPTKVTRQYEGFNSSPSWSPDGKWLAFISFRGPLPILTDDSASQGPLLDSAVLVVRSTDTGQEKELAKRLSAMSYEGSHAIRWSPDSQRILLNAVDLNGQRGLYQVHIETGEVTPIVTYRQAEGRIGSGDWSSDGKSVFYHVVRDGQTIVKRQLDTGQEKSVWQRSWGNLWMSLDVSPDGHTLAFARTHSPTIHLVSTEGGEPSEIVRLQYGESMIHSKSGIAWTPDGKSLLFGKRLPGTRNAGLCQVAMAGGEPMELGLVMDELGHPSMHPDGRRIAFAAGGQQSEVLVLKNFLPPLRDD